MIAALIGWGAPKWLAKALVYVGLPLLVLGLAYAALDAYGDRRYNEGSTDERLAWEKAAREFEAKSDAAAANADVAADAREADFSAALEEERNKIDAAIAAGDDPLDVLFPAGRVQD